VKATLCNNCAAEIERETGEGGGSRWSTRSCAAPRCALLPGLLIQVKSILAFLDAPPVRARLSKLPFMVRYLKAVRRHQRFNRAPASDRVLFADYSCFAFASIRVHDRFHRDVARLEIRDVSVLLPCFVIAVIVVTSFIFQ